ncbi:hypothetical protein FACS1894187_20770 [Synergistales bacterium]|nr:hypothetical protein FACS1894187_20770 [Synergistales bacterium]
MVEYPEAEGGEWREKACVIKYDSNFSSSSGDTGLTVLVPYNLTSIAPDPKNKRRTIFNFSGKMMAPRRIEGKYNDSGTKESPLDVYYGTFIDNESHYVYVDLFSSLETPSYVYSYGYIIVPFF